MILLIKADIGGIRCYSQAGQFGCWFYNGIVNFGDQFDRHHCHRMMFTHSLY